MKCVLCGKKTEGIFSESGIILAICEECYNKDYIRKENREEY